MRWMVALAGVLWGTVLLGRAESPAAATAAAAGGIHLEGGRVVLVVDTFNGEAKRGEAIKDYIVAAVGRMKAEQVFTAIICDEKAETVFPKLQAADEAAVEKLAGALATHHAGGQKDLISPEREAVEKAFGFQPDSIYYLTDGGFDPRVPEVVKKLNGKKGVRVHAVAFVAEAGLDEMLRTMAKENGGEYRLVGAAELPQPVVAKFCGIETDRRRIVFIVDHSGSLLDSLGMLKKVVVGGVETLEERQQFAVVSVGEKAVVLGDGKFVRGTAEGKKRIIGLVDKIPGSGMQDDLLSDFPAAFQKAFALKPEVIFFLTDGHFDPRLMQSIKLLNYEHKVQINTIGFVNHEPSYEEQLRELAKESGGQYKFVSEKEVPK